MKGAFHSSSQAAVTGSPVYHTGWRLYIVLFIVKRQTEATNINFIVFGLTRLEIKFEFTVSSNLRSIHSTSNQNNSFEKVLLIVDSLLVFRNYSITIALTILILYCYYDNICLLVKVHSCTQSLEYKLFTSLICFKKVS